MEGEYRRCTWWCGVEHLRFGQNLAESILQLQSPSWLLLLASSFVAVKLRAILPARSRRRGMLEAVNLRGAPTAMS